MKRKTIIALGLALLMLLSVVSGSLVYAEQPELQQEEIQNELELGEDRQNAPVKQGAPSNSEELSIIAKGNDGKYYGIATTNTSADTSANRVFEEISEEDYNKASAEFALNFKRKDVTAFEIPGAKIAGQSTEAGAIFTELEFKHYSAYRGVIENCNPTKVSGVEDAIWAVALKKDLNIEPVPNYGGSVFYAFPFLINYRCELDGKNFKVYRSGGEYASGLFDIKGTQEVIIQNITIDGSKNLDGTPQYPGIMVDKNAKLKLSGNVVIQNCKLTDYSLASAIAVMQGASLTISGDNVIQNCVSDDVRGSINVVGNTNDEGATIVNIDGMSFLNNKAKSGAAISVPYFHATVTISNCKFENNEATAGEGGAVKSNSFITVQGSTFTGNKASGLGGAFYSNNGAKLEKVNFTNNTGQFGGAIRCFKEIEITNGQFTGNQSETDGGAIATSGSLTIVGGSFDGNKAERGGAVYIEDLRDEGYKTDIKKALFKGNVAENGGAIFASDQEVTIEGSTLKENEATLGGALYADGIYRDEDYKALTDLKVTIQNGNIFESNKAAKEGGAIYTTPNQYKNPIDVNATKPIEEKKPYQNLNIDNTTLFKGNKADGGLFNPPTNYDKFDKLKFIDTSDIPHMKGMSKSLLNNYDINYMGDFLIAYDANGGKFEDGKAEKTENHKDNDEITIAAAPVREGYKFTGWKGTKVTSDPASAKEVMLKPGDKFTIDGNYTFVAQWESKKPEPQPEPKPQPKDEGQIIFFGKPKQEPAQIEETHIAYINGYPDNTVRPEGKITRAEAVTMVVRLKAYPMIEGAGIYKDVAKDAWYAPYVEAAYRQGILEEKAGEAFRPDENITRGELAQLISHIDKKNDAKAPFTDVEGYKYKAAIDQSYGNERILGYPDNTFRPDAEITRAETAAMLNRLFERSVRGEGIRNVEVKIFKDLQNISYWAYYEIIEAANTHTYVRIRPNTVEELWKTVIK